MSSNTSTIAVRFHSHLRLADHPALVRAVERAARVLPVYVADGWDSEWPPGPNQCHWRAQSIEQLAERLAGHGLPLVVRRGEPAGELRAVAESVDADGVYWNRRYRPDQRRRDRQAADALRGDGVDVEVFDGQLLHDPDAVETTSGGPYHVFTPFWKKFLDQVDIEAPMQEPPLDAVDAPDEPIESLEPADLERDVDLATAFGEWWTPGEVAARERLADFAEDEVESYDVDRDELASNGTSRLSPRLPPCGAHPRSVGGAGRRTRRGRHRTRRGLSGAGRRPLRSARGRPRRVAPHQMTRGPSQGHLCTSPICSRGRGARFTPGPTGRAGLPTETTSLRRRTRSGRCGRRRPRRA